MNSWIHDGTPEGLLTALATAIEQKATPDLFLTQEQVANMLFQEGVRVETDERKAEELMEQIAQSGGVVAATPILHCILSELPDLERDLLEYIRLTMEKGGNVRGYHANPPVRRINALSSKVGGEIHRLQGLVRFRETVRNDDESRPILFAPIEPVYNVVYPVAMHFTRRLARQDWIIQDMGRHIAVQWLDGKLSVVSAAPPSPDALRISLSRTEPLYQQLWREYFKSVSIASRSNPSLQRRCMPIRYWKYLVEKS